MWLFNRMKEPVFLKSTTQAEEQLCKLKELEPLLNAEGKKLINQDIRNLECGILGERNIAFELKNSHMPMYILQDVYLEDGDFSAQIDFLVFTKKYCFVIECKNLYGDIEINSKGDFIRTMDFGGVRRKEGIYSPITQNQRHLELMKKIRVDNKDNLFVKLITDRFFNNMYKSIVVLANPKTIPNDKYAKKEVKNKVIRLDQLVKYIKDINANSNDPSSSDKEMLDWANTYFNLHKEAAKDYTSKYEQYKLEAVNEEVAATAEPIIKKQESTAAEPASQVKSGEDLKTSEVAVEVKSSEAVMKGIKPKLPIEESAIFKELKAFRLAQSRKENIKPYFIFNDNQLRDLIGKMPVTPGELLAVSGFGEVKVKKYGNEIIEIVKGYK